MVTINKLQSIYQLKEQEFSALFDFVQNLILEGQSENSKAYSSSILFSALLNLLNPDLTLILP